MRRWKFANFICVKQIHSLKKAVSIYVKCIFHLKQMLMVEKWWTNLFFFSNCVNLQAPSKLKRVFWWQKNAWYTPMSFQHSAEITKRKIIWNGIWYYMFEMDFRNSWKIWHLLISLKIKLNSKNPTLNKIAKQKRLFVIKLMIGLVTALIFTCSIFNFHLTISSNRIRYA